MGAIFNFSLTRGGKWSRATWSHTFGSGIWSLAAGSERPGFESQPSSLLAELWRDQNLSKPPFFPTGKIKIFVKIKIYLRDLFYKARAAELYLPSRDNSSNGADPKGVL